MNYFQNMPVFVEVAKANSFRRAAEVLGLPNSTVSRRVADLERNLGLRLFNRTTRQVELTEAGHLYFANCTRILAEAELAHLELTHLQTRPSGVLRISLPVDFAVQYLRPVLTAFAKHYPTIRFDLDLTPNLADLLGDPVDLAIRMSRPKDGHLIARPIARLQTLLVAAPDYLQKRGQPATPQDLLAHDCLRMKDAPWVLADPAGNRTTIEVGGAFTANNIGLLYQLALEGNGIAQYAAQLAQPDLASGRLVRVLAQWSPPAVQAFAITTTRLLPAKVRVFLEFLTQNLSTVHPSATPNPT